LHTIAIEIPKPKNESDFERMCAQIYGVVYRDPLPKINGRKGQSQGGVDIFISPKESGRIGVQCKKYFLTVLTEKHIYAEVKAADDIGTPIECLLIATTSPNDATLLKKVQKLSDDRKAKSLFAVEVEFWGDIELRIAAHPVLQDSYAPQLPGAAYYRQELALNTISKMVIETNEKIVVNQASLPPGKDSSLDKVISAQLDQTNEFLKVFRFKDGIAHLAIVGKDLSLLDSHQKARWHLQYGLCLWLSQGDTDEAATHFINAEENYPNDDRMSAAKMRGLMLKGDNDAALIAGQEAIKRFPESVHVWLSYANAKLIKGEQIGLDAFPSSMRTETEVLHIAALAAHKDGDLVLAQKISLQAAVHPGAGFFTRAGALQLTVELASSTPVASYHGFLPEFNLEALKKVVELFEPRVEKLWAVQSSAINETASQLGYALLIQLRYQEALDLVAQAQERGISTKELFRVHIQALSEQKGYKEALSLAKERFNDLNAEALLIASELAEKLGDVEFIERAINSAKLWTKPATETIDILIGMRWAALVREGKSELAVREILESDLEAKGTFNQICSATRILFTDGKRKEASKLVERARVLVSTGSRDTENLMLAELFYKVALWTEAEKIYETIAPVGKLSSLHNQLLACHIKTLNRKKAKALLASFPDNWPENDVTRELAIELGQSAGDWEFLRPLAQAQLTKAPERAISWVFQLDVFFKIKSLAEFQDLLQQVPEDLAGKIPSISRLASIELRYGQAQRGLRRLYRLVRRNFEEPEVFSTYFLSIVAGPKNLPMFDHAMSAVVAGTAITLCDDVGQEQTIIIDPLDTGELPKRDGFSAPNSVQAIKLIGAVVGQTIGIPDSFGGVRNFTVKAVQSAYLDMLILARAKADSVHGLPNMKTIKIGTTGDSVNDFSSMHLELRRASEKTKRIFDTYVEGRLTLGSFCRMQGQSPIDVATGWPSDGPSLYVGAGDMQERTDALTILQSDNVNYVTDSLTIAEIVNFGMQEIFATLPNVYISPVTFQVLENYLVQAQADASVGTAADINGKLTVFEHDDNYRHRRLRLANSMIDLVKQNCIVQPAYGDLAPAVEYAEIADILEAEEREMLLLAKEHAGVLFTLDGRLRQIAKFALDIRGVWPQVVLMHCGAFEKITKEKYSAFVIAQFLNNRSFVSLGAHDLVWMVKQGGSYLQRGMALFKIYIESLTTEFKSTYDVAFNFLSHAANQSIHLGAFGELLIHIVEAFLRRKDCPTDLIDDVAFRLDALTESIAEPDYPYHLANNEPNKRLNSQRLYLRKCLVEASKTAASSSSNRPVAIRVLYCGKIPWIIHDGTTNRLSDLEFKQAPLLTEGV
jgi:tetratricopeptide (TPR) repeat protein